MMTEDVYHSTHSSNSLAKAPMDIQLTPTGDNTSHFNQLNPTPKDKTTTKTETQIQKQTKKHKQ